MKKLQRLELLKDFVQEAVDRGSTSVEQIHRYIADLPFEALESTGLLSDDRLGLREKQRRTIGMVYDAIRRINREIGQLISDQLENAEETGEVADLFAAKPTPETKPKPAAKTVRKTATKKKPAAGKAPRKVPGKAPK